ncbi:MAG: hypothetical protein ACREQV_18295 [Candidatus Binatia bacterium]
MSARKKVTRDATSIARIARQLLQGGSVGDEPVRRRGKLGAPLPVLAPTGEQHSWFVPVILNGRLVAFLQFKLDATLLRFSSFQRRPGDLESAPLASEWLNPKRIQKRAAAQQKKDEALGDPFLTYDRTPDRLVWAVPLTDSSGLTKLLYVAGDTVYLPQGGLSFG